MQPTTPLPITPMPDKWAQLRKQASQPDRFQQQHQLLKER
jgi:hypothetical protein